MMNQDNEGTVQDILDHLASDGRDIPALREALRYSSNEIQAQANQAVVTFLSPFSEIVQDYFDQCNDGDIPALRQALQLSSSDIQEQANQVVIQELRQALQLSSSDIQEQANQAVLTFLSEKLKSIASLLGGEAATTVVGN
jgi:uncharacterized protein YggU (UPF0235/DUF167 family)